MHTSESMMQVDSSPLPCLELLETELVRALYNRSDPDRLSKAKDVIERYSGVDWISYQKCQTMDGYQLSGYQRVCVKSTMTSSIFLCYRGRPVQSLLFTIIRVNDAF